MYKQDVFFVYIDELVLINKLHTLCELGVTDFRAYLVLRIVKGCLYVMYGGYMYICVLVWYPALSS